METPGVWWGRFSRPNPWTFAVLGLVVAWIALRSWPSHSEVDAAPAAIAEGRYRVVRVIDGDTLVIAPLESAAWQARLRLIGIDAPETVHSPRGPEPLGEEATAFAREFLAAGEIHLRFDKRRKDRYGRFVGYAFVGERMLNEELVRAGLARVAFLTGDSLVFARQLRAAEDEARLARRGIWQREAGGTGG